jgi:short subunit dehydrogenase-like uncharacterized protein
MPEREWILYGANGYTGALIAEEAARRGLKPLLAGRNAKSISDLARRLNLNARVFDLNEPAKLRESIRGAAIVLNCAGPFSATAAPLMAACLAERVHYLDITGEIDVIELAAARSQEAKAAGVILLPAIGFDVVPSDCLAATLAKKLPDANQLQLAFSALGALSPGTAKTMFEAAPQGGRVRINGEIQPVPVAWKTCEVPFRSGRRLAMTIPWGDVASAYYSTGIGNIEVYAASSSRQIATLRRWRWLLPYVADWPLNKFVPRLIGHYVRGPSADSRDRETSSLWAAVENVAGKRVEATLETPNSYSLTIATALGAVERLLQSPPAPGFLTPSLAFGPDFITSFPGCRMAFSGDHQGEELS